MQRTHDDERKHDDQQQEVSQPTNSDPDLPSPRRPSAEIMTGASGTVYHVTAERERLAKVGGLGEATAGLGSALSALGWEIVTVMPDYGNVVLENETATTLQVPRWAGHCWLRRGSVPGIGEVRLIGSSSIRRPHPYVDPSTGESWPDNDERFFAFSAGVAALVENEPPALLHIHDWHGAAAACLVPVDLPVVFTIHNLAHQGLTSQDWVDRIGPAADPMRLPGICDPVVGAIRRADAVVTVSPTYLHEVVADQAMGIGEIIRSKQAQFHGILNGIDPVLWDPERDPRIPYAYSSLDLSGKVACRSHLLSALGRDITGPIIAVVSRMAEQKGVDLAVAAAPMVAASGGLMIFHGAGQHDICALTHRAEGADHDHIIVLDGYDDTIAHRMIAGADILLMPSRFEPCGLTQMQAMAYGTIPVVTNVGGLHDTVIDFVDRANGTGFVAREVNSNAVADALRRAIATWHDRPIWHDIQLRAMGQDRSWASPAVAYNQIYQHVINNRSASGLTSHEAIAAR